MKKSRRREGFEDNHGETCMCRRCRSRTEALYRKAIKTRIRSTKNIVDLFKTAEDDE
jgi:hypothetical protein